MYPACVKSLHFFMGGVWKPWVRGLVSDSWFLAEREDDTISPKGGVPTIAMKSENQVVSICGTEGYLNHFNNVQYTTKLEIDPTSGKNCRGRVRKADSNVSGFSYCPENNQDRILQCTFKSPKLRARQSWMH